MANPTISPTDIKTANMRAGCHVCSRVDSEKLEQVIFYMKYTAKNRHYVERGYLPDFKRFVSDCIARDKESRVFRMVETFGTDTVQFSKYKNAATTKYSFTIEHRLLFSDKNSKMKKNPQPAST